MGCDMTTRSTFVQRKRRVIAVVVFGFALVAMGVVLANLGVESFPPYLAALPGGILIAVTLLYGQLIAFRCPNCGGSWGPLVLSGSKGPFQRDLGIQYCPFCGLHIE